MRLDAHTIAKAASAALHVFGRRHPLTQALHMAMVDPDDLDDVHAALSDLPREHYKMFAAAFYNEMMPGRR